MAEISGPRNRKRARKRGNLTMEQYLNFLHAEKRPDLPAAPLNQIIFMHGFRKFKKNLAVPKGVLAELVSKLQLVVPTRSTVSDDGVTSDAVLSLDDLINDLNGLQWQEPCITSIQTLNAAVRHHHHEGRREGTIPSAAAGERWRRLRKISDGGPKMPVLTNWGPRKKRTLRRKKSVGSWVGVASSSVATGVDLGAASSSVADEILKIMLQ